jgi:hypothetical protein
MKNKYNFAALFALALAAALVLNTPVCAQAPPGSLWYNGDWNTVNGLSNERNTIVTQGAVYDDFNVTAPQGWNVTAIFSDDLVIPAPPTITGADWEIRTGVSEGNAGALIASGTTNSPIVTLINDQFQILEYRVEVIGLSVFLPMLPSGQHYWLNVTPVGNGTGRFFNSTTSGANCVGTPCGNDQNAFFNSTFFGAYFTSTANEGQPSDYSMGVIGNAIPEPATVALLTCGVGALLITLRRRRVLVRAALFVTAALMLNTAVCAQAPPGSLWYNGDFNSVNGLANERNTIVTQAAVYDDFNVTAPLGWNVTAVFSVNLQNTIITAADWEIRTGVSEGNAGMLVASGTTDSPTVYVTGRCGFGFCEYVVEVTSLNVTLAPGHYWLNVTPVGNGSGRSFNSTTSGANCVGTPCGNNQNAFFNSTYFGTNFTSTSNEGQPYDYSMGVIGAVVPEPETVALFVCGTGALLIAFRRRRGIGQRGRVSGKILTL